MKKIVITTSSFGVFDNTPLQLLHDRNYQVVLNPYRRTITSAEFLELAKDAVGVIAGTEKIPADVLYKTTSLRVISRCGVGIDNIDREAAERRKIIIFNTPDGPTEAVAELTIGLILSLIRNVPQMNKDLHNRKWSKQTGYLLKDKKIGIIGMGRIGTRVAEMMKPFQVQVAYHDLSECNSFYVFMPDFDSFLSHSDIVLLHASKKSSHSLFIGAREIGLMKKGSWLVNMARGDMIDEDALYNALSSGHLSGAALDVFSREPYDGRLTELDNVILTPHVGSYAREARIAMEKKAVLNLLEALEE